MGTEDEESHIFGGALKALRALKGVMVIPSVEHFEQIEHLNKPTNFKFNNYTITFVSQNKRVDFDKKSRSHVGDLGGNRKGEKERQVVGRPKQLMQSAS